MKDNIRIFIKNFELEKWFEKKVAQLEKLEKINSDQLSIVIVGDAKIRSLNKIYRNKDKVTDVLSFAQCDIDLKHKLKKDSYLGEIFINFRQAERQSKNIKKEILDLLVHGYLHLKGLTHNNDKDLSKMRKMTDIIVSKLKV